MAKHINESLEKIIAMMPGIVYWKDAEGNYQGCNDNAAKIAHLTSRKDIIGKTIYDLFDAKVATKVASSDAIVRETKIEQAQEEMGVDLHGNPAHYLTRKVPVLNDNGDLLGIVGISVDITSQKQLEASLILAKEAADAASLAKTMFLANMSHDLKTPLAGIISTAEHLSQSLSDIEAKNHANDIVQSGLRLLELLIEIIEVSRLDTNTNAKSRPSTFKLQALIDDIVQLLKPVIVNKNLIFKVYYQDSIPQNVMGDRWQLYRVILNLLSNAIKFTHKGSISLTLMIEQQLGHQLLLKIIVKDTGIGIPLEKQSIIFEEFTRLTHASDETYKGTGLGLFIVKKFIEAMDGRIQVQSIENKGSVFTCHIPLNVESTTIVSPHVNTFTETTLSAKQQSVSISSPCLEPANALTGIKLLLVEDNVIAARATKAILEALGCCVSIAYTGAEALTQCTDNTYQFIYSDLGLPDMSGFEVCRQIRTMKTYCNTPIVALSAHVDEQIKDHCLVVGMNEALNKPLLREHAKQNLLKYFSNINNA